MGTKPSDLAWHQLNIPIEINVSCQLENIFFSALLCPLKEMKPFLTKWEISTVKWNDCFLKRVSLWLWFFFSLAIRKNRIARILRQYYLSQLFWCSVYMKIIFTVRLLDNPYTTRISETAYFTVSFEYFAVWNLDFS